MNKLAAHYAAEAVKSREAELKATGRGTQLIPTPEQVRRYGACLSAGTYAEALSWFMADMAAGSSVTQVMTLVRRDEDQDFRVNNDDELPWNAFIAARIAGVK